MLEFVVNNYELLIGVLCAVVGLLCFFVTFVRTGSIKKSIENFKEVLELKYRTVSSSREEFKQSFSPEVKDYTLNPATNELEELPIPKNVQKYIDSYVDCALNSCLDRYLNMKPVYDDDPFSAFNHTSADLAVIGDAVELAEEYREKYNLPDSYSISDIYAFVDKRAQDFKSKINKSESEAVVKEVGSEKKNS